MAGLSDYTAQLLLGWEVGIKPMAAINSRFLALFTAAPTSDAGTGGTEVSGGSYARAQIAGALAVSGSSGAPSTGSATFSLAATAPAWLLALGINGSGVSCYDNTSGALIGTVSSITTTTVTLTGNSAINGALNDSVLFSAFPIPTASSGAEPATLPASVTNGAAIAFPQSSASWGTVVAFAIYDAVTAGNMMRWDYLGNYKWLPFTCTSASPGVLTSTAHGFTTADPVVVTAKDGGTLPTTAGSWSGVLTSTVLTVDTLSVAVNTTGTGDGMIRKITQQSIPSSSTFSFAASALTLTAA